MGTNETGAGIPAEGNFEDVGSPDELGGGAYFWVYLSPQNNTAEVVKHWTVKLSQGNWQATISSDSPSHSLNTVGMSGEFEVTASWRKPPEEVVVKLEPLPDSKPDVGCNANCAAMIGIVADESGSTANYWTVWDAFCKKEDPPGGEA